MENKLLIQDLAEAIAIREGITKKKSEAFIKALFETIEEGLISDKFIKIKGLGTFKIISVGERESVNINTGERFSIEGHDKISFTPDTLLKDLINRPFAHFQTVVINDETNIDELENVDNETPGLQENDVPETTAEEDEENDLLEAETEDMADAATEPETATEAADTTESGSETQTPIETEPEKGTAEVTEHTKTIEIEEVSQNAEGQDDSTETQIPISVNKEESSPQEDEFTEAETVILTPSEIHVPTTQGEKEVIPDSEPEFVNEQISEPTPTETHSTEDVEAEKEEEPPVVEESRQPAPTTRNDSQRPTFTEETSADTTDAPEVKPEQIQYIIKELEGKRNIWKTTSMVLLAMLLLMLSYFAGYFRWFCPCELMRNTQGQQNTTLTTEEASCIPITDSIASSDSVTIVPQTLDKDTIPTKMNEEKPQTVTPSGTASVAQPKKQLPPAPVKRPENNYRQLEGGKYKIVGTIGKHEIIGGETIRTIALDVYGSKGYAPYIIVHNNIEDPNNVECGTIIQLPKLERKNK